jgi:hypothetical protein
LLVLSERETAKMRPSKDYAMTTVELFARRTGTHGGRIDRARGTTK